MPNIFHNPVKENQQMLNFIVLINLPHITVAHGLKENIVGGKRVRVADN
jgi:hypothetical protein